MRYRTDLKSDNKLSALGFGCMRLPRGLNGKVDIDKTEILIKTAVENGVNYFDTAYIYGGSEQALGEVFKRNKGMREKIYIATKLPYYMCKSYEDFDRLFNEQTAHLNTGYIDYYLIHNLPALASWNGLCELGIEKWISEKKAQGKIGRIGYSFHGIQSEFISLLSAYDWDFCQIQYNYMNENYQAGTKGLNAAFNKGLPVIIMEPLLGGKLATGLPQKAVDIFKAANPQISNAAWAFKWLLNHEAVTVILSGMNSLEQLNDNIKTADTQGTNELTKDELAAVSQVVEIVKSAYKIPCTGCNYCLPCPKGVNIPGSFSAYNMSYSLGFMPGILQYITSISGFSKKVNFSPKNCVKCKQCEKRCPQHIEITTELEAVLKRMEPFWLRWAMKLFDKVRS